MRLNRRDKESNLDYHKRLIFGKLVDKTLSDIDYAELANYVYGQAYSSDVARRMMYGSCRTLQLLDREKGAKSGAAQERALEVIEEQRAELQKDRQRFFEQRAAYTKLLKGRSRQEELNDILVRTIKESNLPRLEVRESKRNAYGDNDLLVSLNDIHYGAVVDNYWRKYNPEIAAKMLEQYLAKIIETAKLHNSRKCYIAENGDAISGKIHRTIELTNRENVLKQLCGVSELIAHFLAALSEHFEEVIFVSVAGNHSRLDKKEDALLDERLDDLIEWYLKARLQNFKNITIGGDKIDPTMYLVDIKGLTYCGVHGDFDCSQSKLEALHQMVGKPIYAIISGHKHHNKVDEVKGVKSIAAGSFLGVDDYCVQNRILGKPQQLICVCDESGVRCFYDVNFESKEGV